MNRNQYSTLLKVITIVLIVLTPLFVYLDSVRLGYLALNGAWITWSIPAIMLIEVKHEG